MRVPQLAQLVQAPGHAVGPVRVEAHRVRAPLVGVHDRTRHRRARRRAVHAASKQATLPRHAGGRVAAGPGRPAGVVPPTSPITGQVLVQAWGRLPGGMGPRGVLNYFRGCRGRKQVSKRSTHAGPGMHMQQCPAVPHDHWCDTRVLPYNCLHLMAFILSTRQCLYATRQEKVPCCCYPAPGVVEGGGGGTPPQPFVDPNPRDRRVGRSATGVPGESRWVPQRTYLKMIPLMC